MTKSKILFLVALIVFSIALGVTLHYKRVEEQKQIELQRQLEAQRKWAAEYPTLYLKNGNYSVQIGMYELYDTHRTEIVMLGNSHTYLANWNEILKRKSIVNRGIVSDVTAGYLHRLKYVYNLKPRICFLEGGVNDIYANYKLNDIMKHFRLILDTLDLYKIKPVLSSTFFVSKQWPHSVEKNKEIKQLNDSLISLCTERNVVFLNVNPLIAKDDFLRDELTYDGIHLNAIGYSAWAPLIDSVLKKNGM